MIWERAVPSKQRMFFVFDFLAFFSDSCQFSAVFLLFTIFYSTQMILLSEIFRAIIPGSQPLWDRYFGLPPLHKKTQ